MIITDSNDKKHKAIFHDEGEVRFGPAFYSLEVDGFNFGKRFFGQVYLWSSDSRFLTVQEWNSISLKKGFISNLIMLDCVEQKECFISKAENGFIVPKAYQEDILIYTKMHFYQAIIKEFEIKFLELDRWEKFKTE